MHHTIWIAIENSYINSKANISKLGTLSDCVESCNSIMVGDRFCNSFSYIEGEKRCNLAISELFTEGSLTPTPLQDFTQRAFYKFCFPEFLSPFNACTEFMAFTNYYLDLQPKEVFENLPKTSKGLSTCIELCVLSNNYVCLSAVFNIENGTCNLFQEHSLSAPSAFKSHSHKHQIYFENGCIDLE